MRPHFRNRSGSQSRTGWGLPDPHAPGSPDFSARHQTREVEIVGFHPGTVRVDVGGEPAESSVAFSDKASAAPIYAPAATSTQPVVPDLKPGLGKPTRRP